MTSDLQDILNDASIHLLVEVMGGLGDAKTVVFGGLKANKAVVTANKALVSYHWRKLKTWLKLIKPMVHNLRTKLLWAVVYQL